VLLAPDGKVDSRSSLNNKQLIFTFKISDSYQLVSEADNLPPYSADVKKSRSLNSPRPLWACMACNGCALPLPACNWVKLTES
jgi:hypothetical protein